jgi:hypothetical protein
MGAKHSVVTQPVGPLSNKHTIIIGSTGDQVHCPFLMARQCKIGSHEVRYEFVYLLEFSVPDGEGVIMQTEGTDNF